MKKFIKKILREEFQYWDMFEHWEDLKPGMFIRVNQINPEADECGDAYILKNTVGKVCEIMEVADDVEIGCLSGDADWGMLIRSDYIVRGHNGFGKSYERCGRFNCYWTNDEIINFDALEPVDTESIFGQLGESQDELNWAQDLVDDVNRYRPGSLFFVNKIDKARGYDLDYDLLIRIDSYEGGDNITASSFNYLKNRMWVPQDTYTELSWAKNLVETGYWIPTTKEEAAEVYRKNYGQATYKRFIEGVDDY